MLNEQKLLPSTGVNGTNNLYHVVKLFLGLSLLMSGDREKGKDDKTILSKNDDK